MRNFYRILDKYIDTKNNTFPNPEDFQNENKKNEFMKKINKAFLGKNLTSEEIQQINELLKELNITFSDPKNSLSDSDNISTPPVTPTDADAPVKHQETVDAGGKADLTQSNEPKPDMYLPFFINFMCSPGMKAAIAFLLAASVVAFVAATCGLGGAVVASGLLVAGYATAGTGTGLLGGHLLCATGLFSKSNKVAEELPPAHIIANPL